MGDYGSYVSSNAAPWGTGITEVNITNGNVTLVEVWSIANRTNNMILLALS